MEQLNDLINFFVKQFFLLWFVCSLEDFSWIFREIEEISINISVKEKTNIYIVMHSVILLIISENTKQKLKSSIK